MKTTPPAAEENTLYTFQVAPMYQEIALKNLTENDNIRTQALEQFREWITKDPSIKNCRMDSAFLLKFLRIKKFNITTAYQHFKEYLTVFGLYPRWFAKLSVDEPLILDLFLDGVFIPLPERDADGCQVVIYNFKNIDPEKYNQHDIFRLQVLCYHICFEEEETQIAGFTEIFNFSGTDMKRYTMFTIVDFKNFGSVVHYASKN